jgi:hypothetical protein
MVKKAINLKNKEKLLPGDLIFSPTKIAVLTRETKSYWYYIMSNHDARVHKKKLWNLIDENKLSISCKNSKKKRKVQPKWRTLDLHNTRHQDVEEKVKKFLNWAELPVRIVTGNSSKMKAIVTTIVEDYEWHHRYEFGNSGCMIIEENAFDSKKEKEKL